MMNDHDYGFHTPDELMLMNKFGHTGRRHTTRNDDPRDFAHGCIDNPNVRLPGCHYTDDRFKHAQTIWGHKRKRTLYDYSDRFPQWNSKLWDEAHDIAEVESKKKGCEWEAGSVRYFELVLSHFHSQVNTHRVNLTDLTTVTVEPVVRMDHVLTGFNVSNGYDYKVFGYWFPKGKPWDKEKDK
jgi:hypothetical protein